MASEREQGVEHFEYLKVLWKRKAVITCLVFVSVASAALVSYLTLPTYEVSRVLKIGGVGGVPIDSREGVIETITDQRLLEEVRTVFASESTIERFSSRIVVDRRASPQALAHVRLRYSIQADTPAQAVAIADAIADRLIQRHATTFKEAMAVKQRYEEELRAKIEGLTKEIDGMRRTFDGMKANPRIDAAAVILLQANLEDRERSLVGLRRELRDVRLSNLPPMVENTRVIAADAMPTRPVAPKTGLNMVLAGAASFFAGISLAFFLEYWGRITRKRAEA